MTDFLTRILNDYNKDNTMNKIDNSTSLSAIGVDGSDLIVEFTTGHKYRYADAGAAFDGILDTRDRGDSVGRYFNANVKANFVGERVDA